LSLSILSKVSSFLSGEWTILKHYKNILIVDQKDTESRGRKCDVLFDLSSKSGCAFFKAKFYSDALGQKFLFAKLFLEQRSISQKDRLVLDHLSPRDHLVK